MVRPALAVKQPLPQGAHSFLLSHTLGGFPMRHPRRAKAMRMALKRMARVSNTILVEIEPGKNDRLCAKGIAVFSLNWKCSSAPCTLVSWHPMAP